MKKITANIATMPSRINILPKMIASIYDQVDEIRIYFNEMSKVPLAQLQKLERPKIKIYTGDNLTDNGKFFFLHRKECPEYYFTMDDDLIYPKDYVKTSIAALENYKGCVITYHGRILRGTGLNYYRGHQTFRCLGNVPIDTMVDVPGSGVSAFDTEFIDPDKIYLSQHHCMSDLIFAEWLSDKEIDIVCLKHSLGWFGYLNPLTSIWESHNRKPTPIQNGIADKIYKKKYAVRNPK